MTRKLFTIGYTGFTIDTFMDTLQANGIEVLIDAREIPISRKKGFSKSALQTAIGSVGIDYRHLRQLGSPKADRHEVRESGNYPRFFAKVDAHLSTGAAIEQLAEAAQLAKRRRSCLMCCCPDWTHCHRKCLVDALQTTFSFEHLAATAPVPSRIRRAA